VTKAVTFKTSASKTIYTVFIKEAIFTIIFANIDQFSKFLTVRRSSKFVVK